MPNLSTARGKLTPYAFACGYIERRGESWIDWRHCCYVVHRPGRCATARTLTEARRLLRALWFDFAAVSDAQNLRDAEQANP